MYLQDHLEKCSKIPLLCPNSCGDVIPREMVNAFHWSYRDVIDGRVWHHRRHPATFVLAVACFNKFEQIKIDNKNLIASKLVRRPIWSWSLKLFDHMIKAAAKK